MDIMKEIEPDRLDEARRRVDAESAEAVALALDAMHDRAIAKALWERMERELT